MSQSYQIEGHNLKEISEEIFHDQEDIVLVDREKIEFLKRKAINNRRKRARLCAHKDTDDPVHEMIIVHARGNYIPPHKHINKSESFHLIEGSVDLVFFDDEGEIIRVLSMGSDASGKIFYYRIPESVYHSLIVTSDVVVFHEVTKGPFIRSETIFGAWAPHENDAEAAKIYMKHLRERLEEVKSVS